MAVMPALGGAMLSGAMRLRDNRPEEVRHDVLTVSADQTTIRVPRRR
jgi:hypothetical protein